MISDDTDVFDLLVHYYCITTASLLHHYQMAGLKVSLTMESPSKERAILDIKLTQAKHKEIMTNLLPAHAISGCDIVAYYLGIGKGRVIKHLKKGCDLSAIGNVDAPLQQVIDQATRFILACYGMKDSTHMSHTRLLVWGEKEWQRSFVFSKVGISSTNEGGFHRTCEEGPFTDSVVAHYQY